MVTFWTCAGGSGTTLISKLSEQFNFNITIKSWCISAASFVHINFLPNQHTVESHNWKSKLQKILI